MTASAVRTGQTARACFHSLMYPLALRALPTVTVLVVVVAATRDVVLARA